MRYHKEPIPLPGPPPKWLELPEYVRVCDICHGNGKDPKSFRACWCCRVGHESQGVGYVYIETSTLVPDSVLNQINVERDRMQAIIDALEGNTITSYGDSLELAKILDEWS